MELKAKFPILKRWYGKEQVNKYGEFPLFWQDLEKWKPLRAVLKEYEDEQGRKNLPVIDESKWQDVLEDDPIEALSLTDRRYMLARIRLDEVLYNLQNVVGLAQEAEKDPNRSPSPDPIYNAQGKRTNTREVRMRTRFEGQKKQLLEEMLRLKPSSQSIESSVSKQVQRKIYIPVKDFPGRNFIGLIIGPRGDTQKRLEQETGCKIAIRGKGSVKQGRQGKPEDETDELHVIVTGDSEEAVDRAAEKVDHLLRPIDDADNQHKQEQLRQLAIYNGTFRDHETCHHCGEKGHKQWECPKRRATDPSSGPNSQKKNAGRGWNGPIVCRHCGERSHPSADCPKLRQTFPQQLPISMDQSNAAGPIQVLDSEFNDFWAEVNGSTNQQGSQLMSGHPSIPMPPQPPNYPIPPAPNYPSFPPQYPYGAQPPPFFPSPPAAPPPPSFPAEPPRRY